MTSGLQLETIFQTLDLQIKLQLCHSIIIERFEAYTDNLNVQAEDIQTVFDHLHKYENDHPDSAAQIQEFRRTLFLTVPEGDLETLLQGSKTFQSRIRKQLRTIHANWKCHIDDLLPDRVPSNRQWSRTLLESLANLSRKLGLEQARTELEHTITRRLNIPKQHRNSAWRSIPVITVQDVSDVFRRLNGAVDPKVHVRKRRRLNSDQTSLTVPLKKAQAHVQTTALAAPAGADVVNAEYTNKETEKIEAQTTAPAGVEDMNREMDEAEASEPVGDRPSELSDDGNHGFDSIEEPDVCVSFPIRNDRVTISVSNLACCLHCFSGHRRFCYPFLN